MEKFSAIYFGKNIEKLWEDSKQMHFIIAVVIRTEKKPLQFR